MKIIININILLLYLTFIVNCVQEVNYCEKEKELPLLEFACQNLPLGMLINNTVNNYSMVVAAASCLEAQRVREKCKEKGRFEEYFK